MLNAIDPAPALWSGVDPTNFACWYSSMQNFCSPIPNRQQKLAYTVLYYAKKYIPCLLTYSTVPRFFPKQNTALSKSYHRKSFDCIWKNNFASKLSQTNNVLWTHSQQLVNSEPQKQGIKPSPGSQPRSVFIFQEDLTLYYQCCLR